MKVIVAGTRTFNDYALLKKTLDHLFSRTTQAITIVSGDARGADTLGARYAHENKLGLEHYPADWDTYGKSAGYKRNEQMAQNATHLVVFWDGKSKGSNHMIQLGEKYNLTARVIKY